MTKGIRAFALESFEKTLKKIDTLGPTAFRRTVMDSIMKKFESTIASAATHYNYAFQHWKVTDPKAVEGLGRNPVSANSKGKGTARVIKGDIKGKNAVTVVKVRSGDVFAQNVSRAKANSLVASSGGRGRPRLVIKSEESIEAPY